MSKKITETEENIVKSLKICNNDKPSNDCRNCSYYGCNVKRECVNELNDDILALIALKNEKIAELTEEIERLKKINENYAELEQGCFVTGYKKIRNETIKEMEEKLHSASFVTDYTPAIGGGYIEIRHVTTAAVEDIARKMREENYE